MKKIIILLMSFTGMVNAQIINFPDTNFKQYLLQSSVNNEIAKNALDENIKIDANDDGNIQITEALNVYKIFISYYEINDITGVNSFSNLQILTCYSTNITSASISGLNNLTLLDLSNNNNLLSVNFSSLNSIETIYINHCQYLSSMASSGLTNLKELDCNSGNFTTLTLSDYPNLKKLNCFANLLTSIDLTNLNQLEVFNCLNNQISSLNLNGLTNLKELYCKGNNLTNLNLNGLINLEILNCASQKDYGGIGISTIDFIGLTSLKSIICDDNNFSELSISGLPNLEILSCSMNSMNSLSINTLTSLKHLYCPFNLLTSLNINNLTNLTYLDYKNNLVGNISFSTLNNLEYLDCSNVGMSSIDVSNLVNLKSLSCNGNSLTQLEVSNLVNLESLSCGSNQLETLNISNLINLETLGCTDNQLIELDLTNSPKLSSIGVGQNLFTSLDLSNCTVSLENIYNYYDFSNSPNLSYVNLKNGKDFSSFFNLSAYDCPQLSYVCVDDENLYIVKDALAYSETFNAQVNSYCTFTPGGNYNTINGKIAFDSENNGCDLNDLPRPNIKISINDGQNQGSTFTNQNGDYTFYTLDGSFVLTPEIENPTWFTFSPTTGLVNFPDSNNNSTNQDFCITANGMHNDLEIIFYSITSAVPGFNSDYRVIYKNKGNQTLSGNIKLNFDDTIIDFVSSTEVISNQTTGELTWNYTNILPFESRSFDVTMNLNSQTETPPLNMGDILNYNVIISPSITDETPQDNIFTYNQTVNNSEVVNSIECIEGESLSENEIGKYLHYLVNFENTGNSSVDNVVIKDEIDETQYDVSSIQLLNSTNSVTTRVTGNIVEFIFENINLAPAQGNPPVGGHGNVLFKIKSKNDLVSGDFVSKSVSIFFDYNAPVNTDSAITTFENLSNSIFEFDNSVSIYPNPTSSKININSNFNIKSVELYDVQGRVLVTQIGSSKSMDISDKTNGIYFLKITTEKGSKVEKLVKE
ncbi:MAG: T9SS type A sorting domain-containing protein [Flavobacterium sp.]|uniref:T9SS type A sorting domain-containing protein n=1 Tax=Flavobacterium sp. TaxID=239 RepID=UPI0022CA426C|nr:T9SS type A sorting domain-containing protein [Flavobacterium sp.]MCZ8197215.1 T9SS type A sorting domain-containing protein [Flavobacterium sp.]